MSATIDSCPNCAFRSKACTLRQLATGAILSIALLAFPSPTAAGEPICDWLDALGSSAQARLENGAEAPALAIRALNARPTGEAAARGRLELGLALRDYGTADERTRALRAAAATASPITRGALLSALGEALLEAGEHRGAVDAFRTAAAEGSAAVAQRARWRVADALHAGGFAAEAVAAWRPLLSGPLAENFEPSARLAYALDLREAGDPRRAAQILRTLWTGLPERAEGAAAGEALARWREEGDAIPPFSAEERIARAYRLVTMGRAPTARAELQEAERAVPPVPAGLLSLASAAVLLAQGHPADAVREVEPHARSRDAGIRRGVQLVFARAAARERRFADAIAAWRAVAASRAPVPGLQPQAQASLRDDAEFLAAWLELDAGDLEAGALALSRLARQRPGSRRAEDARWFAAWALVRAGAESKAEAALRKLEGGALAPRARYWRARVTADPAARAALLRAVAASEPLGYYGLLACARLRKDAEACEPPALPPGPPPPDLDSLTDAPRLRLAAALAAAGLRDEAIAELSAITGTNGGRKAAPAAAELAAFLGDPLLPFRLARDQLGLSRRSLAWSYPEAWPTVVGPASRAAGVDASLLRAVMRRESAFRTGARSPAGAVGLLQIIPGTSARLAALLGLPATFAEQLEEPRVNVPLGAGYLSLLQERFEEPLVAVAAYNAGPNAVLRWSRDRGGLPLDVWVESIPFRETRDYVRAVLENWAGARLSAGEPLPPIDPDRVVPPPAPGVAF